jgi:hypothetical protein
MEDSAATARRMWTLFEPVHVVSYFAPEALQAFEQAGLRGFWRGYFAGRTAPLGAADAPIVIATYGNFAPSFVRQAVPSVWDLITPARALAVREAGAVAAIRRLLGLGALGLGALGLGAQGLDAQGLDARGESEPESLRAAGDLLLAVTEGLDTAGRPLGGPNAALPVPANPVARLWHAATVLREHRGDGHIAALVAAGIDGCEALVLRVGVDQAGARGRGGGSGPVLTRERFLAVRGWTEAQWDQAAGRLRERGWLNPDGAASPAGLAAHRAVEQATDLAAARPWAGFGRGRTAELAEALTPLAAACASVIPYPNPVGVPPPAAIQPAAVRPAPAR